MDTNQNDNNKNDRKRHTDVTHGALSRSSIHSLEKNVFYTLGKKTEKVTTALYMVSKFITESDALREEVRSQAIVLLRNVFGCIGRDRVEASFIARDAISVAEHVVSLLRTAKMMGSVSNMNADMLERELRLLIIQLDREVRVPESAQDFMGLAESSPHELDEAFLTEFLREESTETPQVSTQNYTDDSRRITPVSDTVNDTTTKRQNTTTPKKAGGAKKRQEQITDIIKEKEEVTIKDLATRITNCSEKTLQRDLAKLIKKDIIIKEGDKRWSTYKIK